MVKRGAAKPCCSDVDSSSDSAIRNRVQPYRSSASTRACYTIFAKFRRKRLRLASGIHSLSTAITLAVRLRNERFHDPEDIMVVDDRTDEVVDEAAALAELADSAPAPDASAVDPSDLEGREADGTARYEPSGHDGGFTFAHRTSLSPRRPTNAERIELSAAQIHTIERMREAADAARGARERHLQVLEARLKALNGSETEGSLQPLEQLIRKLRIEEDAALATLERTIAALQRATSRAIHPDALGEAAEKSA
jgi:hypothetical protein